MATLDLTNVAVLIVLSAFVGRGRWANGSGRLGARGSNTGLAGLSRPLLPVTLRCTACAATAKDGNMPLAMICWSIICE